jgi:RNA polymerase sigma-B factor
VTITSLSSLPGGAHRNTGRPGHDAYNHLLPRLRTLSTLPSNDRRRGRLRGDIITELMPIARNLAGRYSSRYRAGREELVQVGAVGLIQAVDRWSPERAQSNVVGYIVPCVRGEILRYFRDHTWSIHVPRGLKNLTMEIRRVTGPMAQQLGRAPRPSELAERLDVGVEEVLEALGAEANKQASSLEALTGDDAPLHTRVGELDRRLDQVEYWQALRPLLEALPERERTILVLRFYDELTQTQIAERFGISQMQVSRLLARTLSTLREGLLDDSAPDSGSATDGVAC